MVSRLSAVRPNRTGQADLLKSVDRGRPEVSATWSKRRDQPEADSTPLWLVQRSRLMVDELLGCRRNIFRHQDGRLFTEEPFPNNLEAALCVERFCYHR